VKLRGDMGKAQMDLTVHDTLDGVTGEGLKAFYAAADFCNGRTPEQYARAFANSVVRLAYDGDTLVGVARAVTDGVRCASVFDVCVLPAYRQRGIGTALMRSLVEGLPGQFVALICEPELRGLYERAGFRPDTRMTMIVPD
jgi:predicted GNAT family acetyltransferase